MSIAYNTFTPPILASAKMVEPIGDKVIPIPIITNHGTKVDTNLSYERNYGKGLYSDTHNTMDYIYSGVYLINALTPTDKLGNIFDFGSMSDDVSLDVNVWNATLKPQTVNLKEVIGDLDGVELNYNKSTYQPTELQTITLTATADGDSIIDGELDTTYSDTKTGITITGSRVLIFIFEQNKGLTEEFEYYTNVAQSYDREFRQKLRQEPRYKTRKSYQIFNNQYALLDYFAKKKLTTRYNVPLWDYAKYFYTEITADSLYINYGEVPFFGIENISNLMIYKDKDTYEVAQVASISGEVITLKKAIKNTYSRYRVVPLYDAYIEGGLNIQKTNKYTEFDCEFISNEIPIHNGAIQFSSYGDYYINDMVYTDTTNRTVTQDISIVDSGTSYVDLIDERLYNNDIFGINFDIAKLELENYKAFIFDCFGQLKPFWILSRKDEFVFDSFDGANLNVINVTSYTKSPTFNNAHIYFLCDDGVRYERKVLSYVDTLNNTHTLTLSSDLPSGKTIVQTGYLILVRFNSDIISITTENSRRYTHNATCIRLHNEELQA